MFEIIDCTCHVQICGEISPHHQKSMVSTHELCWLVFVCKLHSCTPIVEIFSVRWEFLFVVRRGVKRNESSVSRRMAAQRKGLVMGLIISLWCYYSTYFWEAGNYSPIRSTPKNKHLNDQSYLLSDKNRKKKKLLFLWLNTMLDSISLISQNWTNNIMCVRDISHMLSDQDTSRARKSHPAVAAMCTVTP